MPHGKFLLWGGILLAGTPSADADVIGQRRSGKESACNGIFLILGKSFMQMRKGLIGQNRQDRRAFHHRPGHLYDYQRTSCFLGKIFFKSMLLCRLSEAQAWGDFTPRFRSASPGVTHGATSTRLGWPSAHSGQAGGDLKCFSTPSGCSG